MKTFIAKVSLRGSCCSNSRKAQKISCTIRTPSGHFACVRTFYFLIRQSVLPWILNEAHVCAEGPIQDLPEGFQ